MPRRGRPKKVHDQAKREFCMLVGLGMTRTMAASYLSLSLRAVQYEMRRTPEFRAQVRRAEMEAEAVPLANMRVAARSSWRAAAWYLERVYPRRFARPKRHAYTEEQLAAVGCALIENMIDKVKDAEVRRQIKAGAEETFAMWNRAHGFDPRGPSGRTHRVRLFSDTPKDRPDDRPNDRND